MKEFSLYDNKMYSKINKEHCASLKGQVIIIFAYFVLITLGFLHIEIKYSKLKLSIKIYLYIQIIKFVSNFVIFEILSRYTSNRQNNLTNVKTLNF